MSEYAEQMVAAHKLNRILWLAVFMGIILLLAIGFILQSISFFPASGAAAPGLSNLFLMLTVVLLVAVILMKRSLLYPPKLAGKVLNDLTMNKDIPKPIPPQKMFSKAVLKLRRYYLVIWSIADLIAIIGFVEYALTGNFGNYFIYIVVAVYSLAINYPAYSRLSMLDKEIQQIKD